MERRISEQDLRALWNKHKLVKGVAAEMSISTATAKRLLNSIGINAREQSRRRGWIVTSDLAQV